VDILTGDRIAAVIYLLLSKNHAVFVMTSFWVVVHVIAIIYNIWVCILYTVLYIAMWVS
jgi:hypothetical protein